MQLLGYLTSIMSTDVLTEFLVDFRLSSNKRCDLKLQDQVEMRTKGSLNTFRIRVGQSVRRHFRQRIWRTPGSGGSSAERRK
jgi:hypothetical protein